MGQASVGVERPELRVMGGWDGVGLRKMGGWDGVDPREISFKVR